MIEIFRNKYAKLLGLESLAAHLQDDRKLLLNPFSHDDIETPFYRIELEKTIEEIEQLGRIHKKVIVDYEKIRTVEYKISLLTDHDIYLFKEGTHFQLYNKLGSHTLTVDGKEGTLFVVWFSSKYPSPSKKEIQWQQSGKKI